MINALAEEQKILRTEYLVPTVRMYRKTMEPKKYDGDELGKNTLRKAHAFPVHIFFFFSFSF